MKITARKKSTDPVQEKLREHKDKWNLAAKEFISRIIAFKRALNGRGDAHYSLPPSNIKDPLPEPVSSFLSALTSNFEQLASEALRIEQEQAEYSRNRKKPQENIINPAALPKAASLNKFAAATDNVAEVKLGDHVFSTYIAVTAEEQAQGLMYQEWPPPIMSFVYAYPQINKFWMKNTPSPLDIVFALNGKITAIHKGEPHSTALIGSSDLSDLVVELPFGTCAKMNISVGDEVALLNPLSKLSNSLHDKYFK